MRVAVAGLISLASLLASQPSAHACSCAAQPPTISPADQATDVPTNAILIVQYWYGFKPIVELRNAATNEPVPVTSDVRIPGGSAAGTTVFATPDAPLSANTTYVATISDEYAPEMPLTTSSFTTGDTVDMTPPAFDGLHGIVLDTMQYPIPDPNGGECFSSCIDAYTGHISRIHVDYPVPPPDAVHWALRLYDQNGNLLSETPASKFHPTYFGFEGCDIVSPTLNPDAMYCARMVAYDIAGNVAGDDVELCATARTCAPRARGSAGTELCVPSDECVAAEPPVPPDPPETSGCSTSGGAPGALLVAFVAFALSVSRRRAR